MALSRKNYEAVAAIFAGADSGDTGGYGAGFDGALRHAALELADYFAADNERFDRAHFLKACGVAE